MTTTGLLGLDSHGMPPFVDEVGSANDNGELPEIDTSSPSGIQAAKKQFSEVMDKVRKENPDLSNYEVLSKVAEDHRPALTGAVFPARRDALMGERQPSARAQRCGRAVH